MAAPAERTSSGFFATVAAATFVQDDSPIHEYSNCESGLNRSGVDFRSIFRSRENEDRREQQCDQGNGQTGSQR
jgi:hypothetical protein